MHRLSHSLAERWALFVLGVLWQWLYLGRSKKYILNLLHMRLLLLLCLSVPTALLGNGPSMRADSNITPADSNTKLPTRLYTLRHLREHAIPDSFPYSTWTSTRVNLYEQEVEKMPDTFSIALIDPLKGAHFSFPVRGHVTSPFGYRQMYGYNFHYGTDIKLNKGDTVVAAFDGVVRMARYDRGYGYFVLIAHNDGIETLYGHLSKLQVSVGQEVRSGEQIALGGSTGYSFGAHLHFEIRFLGIQFDPAKVLAFGEGKLLQPQVSIDKSWFEHLVELKKMRYHYIRYGDTLGHIAIRYGTTIPRLCALNGISVRTLLRPGRPLRVN